MRTSSRLMQGPVAACLLASAALAACRQQEDVADQSMANAPAPSRPIVTAPQPPIDRAALLAAVAQAASAAAAGTELPESARSLDGRQFEIRIRFGCRGPATELKDVPLGWSLDQERRRIQVRASPTISLDDRLVSEVAGDRFEAVEGFWIPRPWLLGALCPAAAAVRGAPAVAAEAEKQVDESRNLERRDRKQGDRRQPKEAEVIAPPRGPRIGIAQFFSAQDPRTRRRDSRAYEATYTLPENAAISSQGYNLVLSGRLRALPGSGVIECRARNADSPPECIVSAEFHRVWIEEPESREVIAEWGSG